jgi:pentachlorophenol monooxygenase/3-(3-hydroxy-phenyl)propionate hydroxylase
MGTAIQAAPVVVIGAGPVGQTTALLLARWGVPVVVLDRRSVRDHVGSKAICQQRDVLDIWESVGAGAAIAAEGLTWTTARTFHRGEELFHYPVADPGASAFPPFVNISQARTEEILDERIAAQPLIDLRWGHEVVDIEQDEDSVLIATSDGARIRAAQAVLCGGSRADVLREGLGVSFDGHSFDDRFLICDIRADLPGWAQERRFYFDPEWNPGRQILIHPCPGSTFRIDWQVPADYTAETLLEEERSGALDRRIRAIIGDHDYDIVWSSVYRFHSRCANRLRAGRVLLAGDAAHLVSPFGARGLNSGVADAENAAWKLAYVHHGWAGEELLESYHVERHAAAMENIAVTTATMDFLVPQTDRQRERRLDVLRRAGEDSGAHAEVDSGRFAEPFWYVDSSLTTADPRRPFAGRPPRGQLPAPVPGVLLADAPIRHARHRRLRELARDGVTLLRGGEVDPEQLTKALASVPGPTTAACIDELDPGGSLARLLDLTPGDVWVIRPDAHIAATLSSPTDSELGDALHAVLAAARPGSGSEPRRQQARTSEVERRGPLSAAR